MVDQAHARLHRGMQHVGPDALTTTPAAAVLAITGWWPVIRFVHGQVIIGLGPMGRAAAQKEQAAPNHQHPTHAARHLIGIADTDF